MNRFYSLKLQIVRLDMKHVDSAVPAAAREHALFVQRPRAADDELGVRVVDVEQARLRRRRPPANIISSRVF